MLKLVSAKLTGIPGESGWSQIHEFLPDDFEKLQLRGHLFAVVSTKRGGNGVEAVSSGREIISRLHEEYFGDLSQKPFNAIRTAVQKVISEFKAEWGDIEIAACAFVDNAVFSAAGGGSKVIICRNGAMATILETESEDVAAASGYPKGGDVMLLGTKSFFDEISSGIIRAGLQSPTPDAATEIFAPNVHGREGQGDIGAVVIKFEDGTIEKLYKTEEGKKTPTFTNIKTSAGKFFSRFIDVLPERRIYIKSGIDDEVTVQSKKMSFSVAVGLLILLAVSIGFGIRQKQINATKEKYQGILAEVKNEMEQAISLASVSPDKSRELFADSVQKLDQIKALKVKDPEVEELQNRINDGRESILGEYMIAPDLYLDLTLLASGFKGDTLSSSGGKIFILDKTGKRIVSVEISTKKSRVVAGPGTIDQTGGLASYEDRVFVLEPDGIYEIDVSKKKIIEKTWEGEVLLKVFAANMYVLDKSASAIYRFSGEGASFGSRQNWLAVGTNADFSQAVNWAIDGSVYVLYPNAKVLKFSQGSPQSFSVKNVIPEIGSVDAVFADPDNENVYLLDKAGKRVVVVDKKGLYKAQYIDIQIANAVNLVVSEADKKIILLTGEKLLSIDIKNI